MGEKNEKLADKTQDAIEQFGKLREDLLSLAHRLGNYIEELRSRREYAMADCLSEISDKLRTELCNVGYPAHNIDSILNYVCDTLHKDF